MNRHVTTPERMQKPLASEPAPSGRETSVRTLTSSEIFEGGTEVQILHEEAVYRLKITRQGKLILNK